MKRDIVKIDEDLCNGCALCIPNCHEGALQIIDDKAVLVSDLMCDGLGACLGHCPEGAITIEKREAEPYNEKKVLNDMIPKGKNVIIAHLSHLKEHGETDFLKEGIKYLTEHKDELNFDLKEVISKVHNLNFEEPVEACSGGCPGSQSISFDNSQESDSRQQINVISELRQWPVQMHLINPAASYFNNSDFVLAADCTAFSFGNFHHNYLKGKTLGIACPKLDSGSEIYIDKLVKLIDDAQINTMTVIIMEVPCCTGLLQMAQLAIEKSDRKIPLKSIVMGIKGEILSEDWV
ncbi:ATP-binding protein [Bacteroidota bacterium]